MGGNSVNGPRAKSPMRKQRAAVRPFIGGTKGAWGGSWETGPNGRTGTARMGPEPRGRPCLDELEEDAACWMRSSSACITADVDMRRCPANVPLSCWRGLAASPHRGDATSKAVPISFSGVLAGLWGGRGLVGGAGAR